MKIKAWRVTVVSNRDAGEREQVMIEAPLLRFFERESRMPTEREFRHLYVNRGISFQSEARALIELFRVEGAFGPNMDSAHRQLLAVLTRSCGFKPALVVDNSHRMI